MYKFIMCAHVTRSVVVVVVVVVLVVLCRIAIGGASCTGDNSIRIVLGALGLKLAAVDGSWCAGTPESRCECLVGTMDARRLDW